ncbi:HAD-IC family P-type ATPase [Patescibacteria group bacterium]|nr:HAD-IC family P-type ATPase [Patescibacteria group bacterium]MBU1931377.1 HAD-IC family P-type ATPase [Patescibacteria group bacterium]
MVVKDGLTNKEAARRLEKYGENRLETKKEFTGLRILLQQFKSPLIYILVIAASITGALGEWGDTLVIGLAVVLNTLLGFYQEFKAEQSLETLNQVLAPKAKVWRDGQWQTIEAALIVPGDLVRLELGGRIPADGIVIEADTLSINEAILTGESKPVNKLNQQSKVFMGTIVASGIGQMLVVKTGSQTEMGKIAKSLKTTQREETPLQHQIGKLSRILALVVGFITLALFLIGILEGGNWLEMFETAVAVAVAAIPEGLAVSLTAILALGMQRILKRKAVVRKLVAAETLGATTVICCDKTGTLTQGEMQVVSAITSLNPKSNLPAGRQSSELDLLIKAAVLCNDMRDPLEISMMEWAKKNSKLPAGGEELNKTYPRLDEIPFGPEHKYIATLHAIDHEPQATSQMLFVSGAPEVVLHKCQMPSAELKKWEQKFREAGNKGLRLVGFAYKKVQDQKSEVKEEDVNKLEWLGILLYEDPVRPGVAEALAEARQAGIDIKVITGDYQETAMAVVNKLKIHPKNLKADEVITGDQLEKLSDEALRQKIDKIVLFARTNPLQKLKIVQVLQEKGEVVAMTGDGVNDAPALKRADIGIVVESASDVSKETADIVLLDSNFKTILAAVEEGRKIWENIRKVITYLLSDSFTEVVLIGGALLLRLPLPILATQILWVNLIEDGLPGMALIFEQASQGVMQEKPRSRHAPILDAEMKTLIFIIGIITDLFLFALFYWLLKQDLPLMEIRTFIFTAVGIDSLLYIFSCKSLKKNLWQINLLSNKFLLVAVAIGFIMLLAGIYLPVLQLLLKTVSLNGWEMAALIGFGLFKLGLVELTKYFFLRH